MAEGSALNKASGGEQTKLSQLENELDVIKNQAREVYQDKKATSPVRDRFISSLNSVENSKRRPSSGAVLNTQLSVKPTYIEETNILGASKLYGNTNPSASYQKNVTLGKQGSLILMMKIGVILLVISLITVFIFLLTRFI